MTLNFMLPRNFTTKAYEGLARLKAFRLVIGILVADTAILFNIYCIILSLSPKLSKSLCQIPVNKAAGPQSDDAGSARGMPAEEGARRAGELTTSPHLPPCCGPPLR